jgi:hypothetical protein
MGNSRASIHMVRSRFMVAQGFLLEPNPLDARVDGLLGQSRWWRSRRFSPIAGCILPAENSAIWIQTARRGYASQDRPNERASIRDTSS